MIIKDYLTAKEACKTLFINDLKYCGYHWNIHTKIINNEVHYSSVDLLNRFISNRGAKQFKTNIPSNFKKYFINYSHLTNYYNGNEKYISIFNLKNWSLFHKNLNGEIHCVYVLFKNNEMIYIGRTVKPKNRIMSHRYKIDFDKVHLLIYDDLLDVEHSEIMLIRRFTPKLNKKIK